MKKEKVFIVLTHKHQLKLKSKTDWEVVETVEFVNQLRDRHYTTSVAIGDFVNRKMITGARHGMTDYDKFQDYISTKYKSQFEQLTTAYGALQAPPVETTEQPLVVDQFGNRRQKTVFDVV